MIDDDEKSPKDSDGLYICPRCGHSLVYAPYMPNKDYETMGGYSIEYAQCPKCKGTFEVIEECVRRSDFKYQEEENY